MSVKCFTDIYSISVLSLSLDIAHEIGKRVRSCMRICLLSMRSRSEISFIVRNNANKIFSK